MERKKGQKKSVVRHWFCLNINCSFRLPCLTWLCVFPTILDLIILRVFLKAWFSMNIINGNGIYFFFSVTPLNGKEGEKLKLTLTTKKWFTNDSFIQYTLDSYEYRYQGEKCSWPWKLLLMEGKLFLVSYTYIPKCRYCPSTLKIANCHTGSTLGINNTFEMSRNSCAHVTFLLFDRKLVTDIKLLQWFIRHLSTALTW